MSSPDQDKEKNISRPARDKEKRHGSLARDKEKTADGAYVCGTELPGNSSSAI